MAPVVRKTQYSGPSGRRQFRRDILLKAARFAELTIARNTRSGNLRNSLYVAIGAGYPRRSHVRTDYYWAGVYNDGRSPVAPRNSKYLLWFRNPRLDPRFSKGYPATRLSEVGKLRIPKIQLKALITAGQVVVRKKSPRSGQVDGEHFMDGISGSQAALAASKSIAQDVRDEIRKRLGGVQKFNLMVGI